MQPLVQSLQVLLGRLVPGKRWNRWRMQILLAKEADQYTARHAGKTGVISL